MIDYSLNQGVLLLRVQVVPRASKTEIVGEHDGALRIRIAAPPVDGAANDELIRVLAKRFAVSRSSVSVVAGLASRTKQVRIEGVTVELVKTVLKPYSP